MPRYHVSLSRHDGTPVGEATLRAADTRRAAQLAREQVPFSRYAVAIVTELRDGGEGDQ